MNRMANRPTMRRPNILFLMADDLGVAEPSFTSPGRMHTPNIDRLARTGMRFTAAYAGYTVCAPSRATLMTGRNSGRLSGAPSKWPLLPTLLRRAGYETAVFGKSAPFDMSDDDDSPLAWGLPTQHGFDVFAGQPKQRYCHNMYPEQWHVNESTVLLPLNTNAMSRSACMANPAQYNYTTDLFADAAISWLRARRRRGPHVVHAAAAAAKPFFAYLSFTVPHAGGWGSAPQAPEQGQPVPSDMQYAARSEWPEVERDHAASVSYLDSRIGDVLNVLETTGLAASTIIFFASDNGAHNEGGHNVSFFNSTGGLRGFKRSYYEGGVRSPSLVRWPGVTAPNTISHTPWAFWDVLPTLLEIAQAVPPRGMVLDGRSIVRALRGQPQPPPEYLYWTWRGKVANDDVGCPDGAEPSARSHGIPPGYAARVGQWKAVVHACSNTTRWQPSAQDRMELYDLSEDPAETTDVAAMHADVVWRIKALLISKGLSCECFQCG